MREVRTKLTTIEAKTLLNTKNLLIAMYIGLALLCGFVLGLRMGTIEGARNNTEVRNQMLNIEPYDTP